MPDFSKPAGQSRGNLLVRFGIGTVRVLIAAFAASSAGLMAATAVPAVLFHFPQAALTLPSRTLLLVMFAFSMMFGIPFFWLVSTPRRMGPGSYVGYSVLLAVVLMTCLGIQHPGTYRIEFLSEARLYDLAWVLLTEAVPGGIAAGITAYSAMTLGRPPEPRTESLTESLAETRAASAASSPEVSRELGTQET